MALYLGDDWSEDHHEVHLMNDAGERLAARRLPEGVEGITALHALVAEHASGPGEVIVGIETDRGPWVAALLAAGYRVYAINPRSASRYRDRHHVGGAKSDAGDAKLLADLVRTDRHNHREVAGDSDEAAAVRILARAHQQLVWDRTRQTNRLRNALRADRIAIGVTENRGARITPLLPNDSLTPSPRRAPLGGAVSPGGTTTHAVNTAVTLTASWNATTHSFAGWGGDCSGTATTCTLTMSADSAVTASFTALCANGTAVPNPTAQTARSWTTARRCCGCATCSRARRRWNGTSAPL